MFLVKKSVQAAAIIMMFFSLSAFAVDDAVNTGRFNSIAIDGYDTVAYFTQNKAVEGDKAFKVKWRDAYWYFDNKENKALFEAAPEKYAPQYGGWCAYAMVDEGNTVRIDPDAFHIYENKLYLNYSKSVNEKWLKDKLTMIKDADYYYPLETNVKSFIKE
ncbi:YHS domain-containing (seleno)protein [Pseudocolwellia sp. HL-MZ7]|uniref:YHS domain-containing (seleno)protein n=1 Tax=Pseudocolwellia sp. HL-MZ7 TaxID=3400627 RepID=UPI003CEB333C